MELKKLKRKKLPLFGLLIVILAIAGVFYVRASLSPVNQNDKTPRVFTVKKGEGLNQVIANLKQAGLIKDEWIFSLLTRSQGLEKRVQAGDFRLNPSMDANAIIQGLLHGTVDIWLTIPEGWRAEEIAEYSRKQLGESKFGIDLTKWRTKEGFLFPETYRVPTSINEDELLTLMDKTFREKFYTQQSLLGKTTENLSLTETVILASLVEREAKYDEDRPMIADILIKRWRVGMALQVDATVQYAIGKYDSSWWKKELTLADLKFISPYNTYLHAGLPPGPICNPGMAALEAVIAPAKTEYWYYLADKTGKTHYGRTMAEHQANIGKYLE
ncbi:MAG: endolytic transglycosylase MltG [bacterium]|nr:endolytic transglycosylase MltG [bacterium]